jgi:hypothetical protein
VAPHHRRRSSDRQRHLGIRPRRARVGVPPVDIRSA